jgi:iron complex transport system substrate-binding protein
MKIISLQPSVSVILDRLDRLDSLVACTRYCLEAVPALRERNLPIVHDSWSTDPDELLPIHADLVIASVPYQQESLAAILKSGQPLLALAPHTLADVYADIRHIAHIIDAAPKGEAVITEMQAALEVVHAQTRTVPVRPLVYCEEWGKPLIHSQPWVAKLVEIAGGEFLGNPGSTTTLEAVADADPGVIIAAWCGAGNRVPLEKVITQRNWQNLPAAREGRVYCISDELLNTPAPNLIDGLYALASAIHPEVFGEPREPSVRRIGQFSVSSV